MKAKERKSGSGSGLRWIVLAVMGICLTGVMMASAQGIPEMAPPTQTANAALVTINVDNGPITQVLNAFSRQTGRNIVVGSEVTGNVTLRVTDIPWQAALDVILKPYGFDYYMVGDTIIICGVDKMPKGVTLNKATPGAAPIATLPKLEEPLVVKVFTLKYLDASDITDLIQGQLSPKGKIGRVLSRSQSWQEHNIASQNDRRASSENLGRLDRFQETDKNVRGSSFVVIDIQGAISRVESLISQIDKMPIQVEIEARFVEVRADLLRDIGVEWGTGLNGVSAPGVKTIGTSGAGSLYAAGAQQINGTVKPSAFFSPSALSGARPFDGGLTLAFQKLTDLQLDVLLHLLQEDNSYNVLSSPRIMTINNQDAVIIVGDKLPIIMSTVTPSGGVGGGAVTGTQLDHYEDIGIKLKVMPQVCDDGYLNLIVHPSVRELIGYESGVVGVDAGLNLTRYPIIATREAETHVLVKSGNTIVIGGMIRNSKQTTQIKVPVLGSIPLLGALFRRETISTEKKELLIFLTATIRDSAKELAVKMPEGTPLIKVEKATPTEP